MLSQWDVCDVVSHLNTIRNLSKRKRTNEFAEINGHFVPKNSCSQNSRLEWWRRLYQKEWFYLIERKYLEHSTLHECVVNTKVTKLFSISFALLWCVVGTCTYLLCAISTWTSKALTISLQNKTIWWNPFRYKA